jgi:hypothetical protein
VSINDELMKEHNKTMTSKEKKRQNGSAKVPAHYYDNGNGGGDSEVAEAWEQREARKAERKARRLRQEAAAAADASSAESIERRESREDDGEEDRAGGGGRGRGRGGGGGQHRRGPDGRRLIPAYYYNGEPSPNRLKRTTEDEQEVKEKKGKDDTETETKETKGEIN